jgi:NADH:ubiquinone oxidoreductase subunit 2 (subunit N)
MKTIKEFLKWLVFNNTISLVYYLVFLILMLATFHEKQSIVDNNNVATFAGIVMFLIVCLFLFTFFSVLPEYKKRND